jgi:zinc/manganese transport system substrate-binding protein
VLRRIAFPGVVAVVCLAAFSCSAAAPKSAGSNGRIQVVAAESFWGSIAEQLGGEHVQVTDIIDNPDTDPHDYEPAPPDARAFATARYVIVNGLGYDSWASDLLDASPSSDRMVLTVGDLLALHLGDNPHRWYFPDDVTKVIDRITADYKSIDPANASFYDEQHDRFTGTTLKPYHDLIDHIRSTYAGTPVGASESVAVGLTQATGLDLVTPESFLDAVTEGNDPSASDKIAVDSQISGHQISVFIFNSQNATPDVQRLVDASNANGIPVVAVTETPMPEGVTFQDWQTKQLQQLADALAQVARR